MNHNQQIGRWGENVAADFFSSQGFVIAGRNVRTPYGEIDLIVRRDNLTVFVEVKARTSSLFGPPEVAISSRKQEHLHAAVEHYLQEHIELGGDWRIDALAVEGKPAYKPVITHFENAI
jgi:putative endonuclease